DQRSEVHDRRVVARPVRRAVIHTEPRCDGILGHSAGLTAVLTQLTRVAPTDATVLLQGETGTGKALLESQRFGHAKGACTGALTPRLGRCELANRGTLVLDDSGDLPLALQPQLLWVLQDHACKRLGSSRTLRTHAREVAATHRDVLAMVLR